MTTTRVPVEGGTKACEILGLDPRKVLRLGFGVTASGLPTADIELLLDRDELNALLDALRG